jgi:hypothetical protein
MFILFEEGHNGPVNYGFYRSIMAFYRSIMAIYNGPVKATIDRQRILEQNNVLAV